jgi:DHA1 family tetracycline resistance protein-like MFS transporter
MFQGNVSVFLKDILSWGPKNIGFMLFVVGIVDIVAQGYITPKLLPRFGDIALVIAGAMVNGVGIGLIGLLAHMPSIAILFTAIVILNIGDGMFQPAMASLISKSVEQKKQGRVQGANQSIQAISRVLGPLAAAGLYQYNRGLPYFAAGVVVIIATGVIIRYVGILRAGEEGAAV